MKPGGYRDHFSGHAASYARFRPRYPRELFDFIAAISPGRTLAWDCATGAGQAAVALADYFGRVVATDASSAQIAHAATHPRVSYTVGLAERAPLREACADVVTVAQALHWFDFDAFYGEAARILRPGGAVCAWCYGLMRVAPAIDAIVDDLYDKTLAPYWPPERSHVDAGYRGIPFPFAEVTAPALEMRAQWTLGELTGYLATWSAVQRCIAVDRGDPLSGVAPGIAGHWGDPGQTHDVRWPLAVRAGHVAENGAQSAFADRSGT